MTDTSNTPTPRKNSTPYKPDTGGAIFQIDVMRVISRAINFWYLFVLCLAVSLVYTYLKNRYTVRIYPVSASIVIKEQQELSGGKLLYDNPLVSYHRNYYNELYLIRSFPLVEAAIEHLQFETSFFKEGNFLITEAYKNLPVSISVDREDSNTQGRFYFTAKSELDFVLSEGKEPESRSLTGRFGDSVRFAGLKFIVEKKRDVSGIIDDPYLFVFNHPKNLVNQYVGKLNAVWAQERAGIINLSTSGSNPQKEIDFLNGIIKQYQTYDLEKKNQAATLSIEFISNQLKVISDSLRRAELKVQGFRSKSVTTEFSQEITHFYERIKDLELQKTQLLVSEKYFDYLIQYINKSNDLGRIILPTSVGISDNLLSSLVSELVGLESSIKIISGSEPSKNPLVRDQLIRRDDLKASIIEAVKNQTAVNQITINFIDRTIAQLETQMGKIPDTEREYLKIKRDFALLENLYVFLLQKRAEVSISKAANTSDIVIVNPPMVQGGAITPRIGESYVKAVALGLGIPFLFCLFLELFNRRVQSRDDILKYTSIPVIGGIGHKRSDGNLEVLSTPKSGIAESFRALRSNLNFFLGGKQRGAFLITSSISGEGKTFTSINLASVLALSNRRTLIVGADLRKPKIFADFELGNSVGLTNYLAMLAEFDEIVQKTKYEYLDMVSGGPVPPNPSELLLTERMKTFLDEAKSRYDYVILDTPPIALVSDALSLSSYCDHTIFVVRQNYTPKALLQNADDLRATGRLVNASIVFNDIYRSGPGYGYGYSYGYGYGYGYGYYRSSNGQGYYS